MDATPLNYAKQVAIANKMGLHAIPNELGNTIVKDYSRDHSRAHQVGQKVFGDQVAKVELGQTQVICHSDVAVQAQPLFKQLKCIPKPLMVELQSLPEHLKVLSIINLLKYFGNLTIQQLFEQSSTDLLNEEETKTYKQITDLFYELTLGKISKSTLETLYLLKIDSKNKNAKNKISDRFIEKLSLHMRDILNGKASATLSPNLKIVWECPISLYSDVCKVLNLAPLIPESDLHNVLQFYTCRFPHEVSSITAAHNKILYPMVHDILHASTLIQSSMTKHHIWSENTKEIASQVVASFVGDMMADRRNELEDFQSTFEVDIQPCVVMFAPRYYHRLLHTNQLHQIKRVLVSDRELFDEALEKIPPYLQRDLKALLNFMNNIQLIMPFAGWLCHQPQENLHKFTAKHLKELFLSRYSHIVKDASSFAEFTLSYQGAFHLHVHHENKSDCFKLISKSLETCCSYKHHLEQTLGFLNSFKIYFEDQVLSWEKLDLEKQESIEPLIEKESNQRKRKQRKKIRLKAKKAQQVAKQRAGIFPTTSQDSSVPQVKEEFILSSTEEALSIDILNSSILNSLELYAKTFENEFSQLSLQSAIDQYHDLIAEVIDQPPPQQSLQVASYMNRIVVVSSLLIEQLLSAHVLKKSNPKSKVESFKQLNHGSNDLYKRSGLNNPSLESLIKSLNALEIHSRYIYTEPRQQTSGANIVYRAEEMLKTAYLDPSKDLEEIHAFLKKILSVIAEVTNADITSEKISSIITSFQPDCGEDCKYSKKCEKLASLEAQINQLTPFLTNVSNDLQDVERLLRLARVRFSRGDHNKRNFYKEIATLLPLAIEKLAIALIHYKNQSIKLDLRANKHNIMDLLEQIGLGASLNDSEVEYLNSVRHIHNLVRYSPLYRDINKSDVRKEILRKLSRVSQAPNMERGWTEVGSQKRAHETTKAIDDLMQKTNCAIAIIQKLVTSLNALVI